MRVAEEQVWPSSRGAGSRAYGETDSRFPNFGLDLGLECFFRRVGKPLVAVGGMGDPFMSRLFGAGCFGFRAGVGTEWSVLSLLGYPGWDEA